MIALIIMKIIIIITMMILILIIIIKKEIMCYGACSPRRVPLRRLLMKEEGPRVVDLEPRARREPRCACLHFRARATGDS